MTKDDIIRMAREINEQGLESFAAAIAARAAAAEREACARVCDLVAREIDDTNGTATYCAAAIRARGEG